jgi:hypothetical protein
MIPNDVSIKALKKILKRCRILLRHYQGKITIHSCPLCGCIRLSGFETCRESCPWGWFTGRSCTEVYRCIRRLNDPYSVTAVRSERILFWVERRVPELKNWILWIRREVWRRRLQWIMGRKT